MAFVLYNNEAISYNPNLKKWDALEWKKVESEADAFDTRSIKNHCILLTGTASVMIPERPNTILVTGSSNKNNPYNLLITFQASANKIEIKTL